MSINDVEFEITANHKIWWMFRGEILGSMVEECAEDMLKPFWDGLLGTGASRKHCEIFIRFPKSIQKLILDGRSLEELVSFLVRTINVLTSFQHLEVHVRSRLVGKPCSKEDHRVDSGLIKPFAESLGSGLIEALGPFAGCQLTYPVTNSSRSHCSRTLSFRPGSDRSRN